MEAYEIEINEKEFEDTLNREYDTITIMGMEYDQGTALKRLDPIAFRCALSDEPVRWACSECDCEFEYEEDAEECCTDDV